MSFRPADSHDILDRKDCRLREASGATKRVHGALLPGPVTRFIEGGAKRLPRPCLGTKRCTLHGNVFNTISDHVSPTFNCVKMAWVAGLGTRFAPKAKGSQRQEPETTKTTYADPRSPTILRKGAKETPRTAHAHTVFPPVSCPRTFAAIDDPLRLRKARALYAYQTRTSRTKMDRGSDQSRSPPDDLYTPILRDAYAPPK